MKKKILLAVCALLTVVFITGALCGCNATPKRVAGAGNADVYPTVATTVTELDGANIVSFDRELAVVTKQDGNTGSTLTGVYSFEACKFVVPFDAQSANFDVDAYGNVFSVTDADTGKITYYDRKGNVLAQNVSAGTAFNAGVNCVEIGDNIYNVADGELKGQVVKGFGYDADILHASEESENYYYYFAGQNVVKVFSKETCSLVAVVDAEANAYDSTTYADMFVLCGDKIVLQYCDRLPDDATRYDVAVANTKYDIRHYLYDVAKDKLREVKKFNYYIEDAVRPGLRAEDSSVYGEDIANVLEVYKIDDKKQKSSVSYISVNDNLKVKYDFDDITEGAFGAVEFGEGYVVYSEGESYVYSKNNKFVAYLGDATVNGKYAVVGGSIYVLEGKEMVRKASYDANTYRILSLAGDHVLLQAIADGKYYGCAVGAAPEAFSGTVSYIANSRIYAVTDGTGAIAIYSVTGTQLLDGLSAFDVQATYVGADGKVTTLALINGSQYIVIR